jgi:hypothetical protein
MNGTRDCQNNQPYQLLRVECGPNSEIRALIGGPGTGRGVWYTLTSDEEIVTLVQNLNLSYFYAMDLKSKRRFSAARHRPADQAVEMGR